MNERFLIAVAILSIGCVQGGQSNPPPPPVATVAPVAPAEPAAAPAPEASAAVSPADATVPSAPTNASPRPTAAPRTAPAPRPAAPSTGASAAAPASAPAPAVPAPTRVRMSVPVGTLLPLEIETTLSSATSHEGDPVLAILTEDVPLRGFKLDKGAEVRGRVLIAIPARRVKGQARLAVGFDTVMKNGEKLAIATETIDNMAQSTSGKDKKIIAGGAVGGLILGAIKDGKKGAAIGTVLGAAAGTGAVLILKGDEVELPRGARVSVAVVK